MLITFDSFDVQERPGITLCNPDQTQLYSLNACYDTEVKLKWNAVSEFNFVFPKTIDGTNLEAYDYIEGKRVVKIETLGYFIIHEVIEDFDGSVPIKRVACLSREYELVYKRLASFSGTYLFYNASNPYDETTLLGAMFTLMPNWTIGTVDASVAGLYRTFDVSDTNVYNFLTVDVETAYGCVFIFDYENRSVSVISSNQAPSETDIFLSFDNLIENTEYTEITSEIATCLYCYGGDGLTIHYVNPLGTNAIYDFTYYKTTEWMTQPLINAITAWETKITSASATYANWLLSRSWYEGLLLYQQSQLVEMQTDLATYQEQKAVRVQQGLSTTDIDALIAEVQQDITEQNLAITSTQTTISSYTEQLADTNDDLALDNSENFTVAQQLELANFIYEGTYTNDSIIITESMTFAEIQAQSQQLYNAALETLDKVSVPRYEIQIDGANFLALKDYEVFIDQLEIGSQITVDTGKGYFIDATLLELNFSYDDPQNFSLVIGNRNRIDNSHFQLTDFIGQGASTNNGGDTLFLTAGGSGTTVMEDLTSQVGSSFATANVFIAGSLRIYVNGILQRLGVTYTEGSNRASFTMLDSVLSGDTLIVEYTK